MPKCGSHHLALSPCADLGDLVPRRAAKTLIGFIGSIGVLWLSSAQAAPRWDQMTDPLIIVGRYLKTSELCALIRVSHGVRQLICNDCALRHQMTDRGVQVREADQRSWVDPAQKQDWGAVEDILEIHPQSLSAGLLDHLPLLAWRIQLKCLPSVEPIYLQSISRMFGNSLPHLRRKLVPGEVCANHRLINAARVFLAMHLIYKQIDSLTLSRAHAVARKLVHIQPYRIDHPPQDLIGQTLWHVILRQHSETSLTRLSHQIYLVSLSYSPFLCPWKSINPYLREGATRINNSIQTSDKFAQPHDQASHPLTLEIMISAMDSATDDDHVLSLEEFTRLLIGSATMTVTIQILGSMEKILETLLDYFSEIPSLTGELSMFSSSDAWTKFRDQELGDLQRTPTYGHLLIPWIEEIDRIIFDSGSDRGLFP